MAIPPIQNIQLTLSIAESKCTLFCLSDYAKKNTRVLGAENYEFAFAVNFDIVEALKQARVIMSTKLYDATNKDSKKELAELNCTHLFTIQNFDEIIKKDPSTNTNLMPLQLIEICNSISASTARGMYSVKLENTPYSNAILPLIDPKSLIPPQPNPIPVV